MVVLSYDVLVGLGASSLELVEKEIQMFGEIMNIRNLIRDEQEALSIMEKYKAEEETCKKIRKVLPDTFQPAVECEFSDGFVCTFVLQLQEK